MVNSTPITISSLTSHIATLFEGDEILRDVWVSGEISGWKRATSGHIYFTLKDAGAAISAVMWKGNAFRLNWQPQAGDQVTAHGYVGVYPERGSYQFYADQMRPAGRGQLYARFEALKAKLAQEGLFDAERKRPIPTQPRRMGVVTSAGAAALRDILRTLSQRWPLVEVLLFPTLVQGADAPAQIVQAIRTANRYSAEMAPIDTLILGRGGGSIEDLWAFNDEGVARAISASALPIIAGVGHEVDFSIADFVADLRAATPTAAASAAVPDRAEVVANLWAVERGLADRAWDLLTFQRTRLNQLTARLDRVHPRRQLDLSRQRLDDRSQRLHRAAERLLPRRQDRLAAASLRLGALNPARVLERGYSIVQRLDGKVVMGPEGAAPGEELHVRGAKGEYRVQRLLV